MENTSKPEAAVLIGRFQPFHNGHAALLAQALASAPKVIMVLGSSFHARSARNPFTWQERVAMIAGSLSDSERERVEFVPVRDYFDDQRWSGQVRSQVAKIAERVALVAFFKDASSYYLKLFPDWPMIPVESPGVFDATAIRRIMFEAGNADTSLEALIPLVPAAVREYLRAWRLQPQFEGLVAEHKAIEAYKASWKAAPYTPIFSTVDSVVTSGGHVLLIRRNGFPGKGLWAIPGGFVEPTERLLQAAIRELGEETQLTEALDEAFVGVAVFDHPQRSQRGRTITHAHHFELKGSQLPAIQAADDAALAKWVPIKELASMEEEFFEDHYHILDRFLNLR
jgi:bifunctional NMN adenylyltransferase/nudix hydrolase